MRKRDTRTSRSFYEVISIVVSFTSAIAHSSSWGFNAQLGNKFNCIFIENLGTEEIEKKCEFPVLPRCTANLFEARDISSFIERRPSTCV